MIIIPAIDLKEGKCVRLAQGDFNRQTVYSDDPVAMAVRWQNKGARRIHVVDLDGSRAGRPQNMSVIADIVQALKIPIEVGGGIRDMKTAETYIAMGVRWVILGTAALRNETFVAEACRSFPERVIVGIDAMDGLVAVQGWTEKSTVSAHELAERFREFGPAAIVYTDISRDGMETGVNVEATKSFAEAVRLPVIASGGVSGIGDIERLLAVEHCGIMGVIAGKSLYTGALTLENAIAIGEKREQQA